VRAKTVVAGLAAAALAALVFGAAKVAAEPAQPAASASTCTECCEGDAVCEALAGLADLHNTVVELVPQQGTANTLNAKVDAATNSVLAGNIEPALNQIDAFLNEVDALVASGRMYTAISNIMKTKHDTVKNSISNVR
jgi:hypothetical protein